MQLKRLTLSVMLMGVSAATMASGYHFGTQSVSSQSTANASAAEAADASTIFYNAAGMTKLEGTNFSGALNLVAPSVSYSNAKGNYTYDNDGNPATPPTNYNRTDGPAIASGSTSGKITDDLVAVPHFYLTHRLNEKVVVGVGIYVPFASSTEYQRDSVLRYNLNATELKTIDINPTVAFKLNDMHSVAVGVIAQHAEASLRQYSNFSGTLTNGALNGASDGFADVNGDDWGYGYNLAWMWDLSDKTRIGVNYRSKIKHSLQGEAKWALPGGNVQAGPYAGLPYSTVLQSIGFKPVESARVDIVTPESLSLHGLHKFNSPWTMFGDITWTKHSRFNSADLIYGNGKGSSAPLATVTKLNPKWKDTFKVALGASYQYSDSLQLRGGVAFDESPVPSDNYRLATMPDNDRYWLSMGLNYKLNKSSSLDFAYSYIMIKDAKAVLDGTCTTAGVTPCVSSQTKASADYSSHAQILGVQYNYKF